MVDLVSVNRVFDAGCIGQIQFMIGEVQVKQKIELRSAALLAT
jgi:hypothetical protein